MSLAPLWSQYISMNNKKNISIYKNERRCRDIKTKKWDGTR